MMNPFRLPASLLPARKPGPDERTFARKDRDHDGKLDVAELSGRACAPTAADHARFDRFDRSNDGWVSQKEYVQAVRDERRLLPRPTTSAGY